MQFPDFFEEETDLQPVNVFAEDVEIPDFLPTEDALAGWLDQMATREGRPLVSVSYIFCSDEYLLKVNIDYLQHDYYTDIITFQTSEGAIHGDMYISLDRVQDNAQQLGTSYRDELLRVMAHGALHLAGYGDKSPEEATIMRQKEEEYLAVFVQSNLLQ